MSKTILVACGTGIATSTLVAASLQEALKNRGISVETRHCLASEIASKLEGIDLIVSTTPVASDVEVPVIQTLAFLTGIGKEEVLDRIVSHLQ